LFGGHVSFGLPEDQVRSAEVAIAAGLDPNQLAQFKARGAAMDLADAMAYLRHEVDRVLADAAQPAGG
jgi:hypothetical protein